MSKVKSLRSSEFDSKVLRSVVPVLVFFTAQWDGPSRALAPAVDKVGAEFEGKIKAVSVDVDACRDISERYGVRSLPALMVFRGGQKVASSTGLTTRDKIVRMLGVAG